MSLCDWNGLEFLGCSKRTLLHAFGFSVESVLRQVWHAFHLRRQNKSLIPSSRVAHTFQAECSEFNYSWLVYECNAWMRVFLFMACGFWHHSSTFLIIIARLRPQNSQDKHNNTLSRFSYRSQSNNNSNSSNSSSSRKNVSSLNLIHQKSRNSFYSKYKYI